MRLIIHGGCHKTATTWFQSFCNEYRDEFRTHGVFYPTFDHWNQHSYVVWKCQAGDYCFFAHLRDEAAAHDCHTVLLSGEDFENCLVDIHFAQQIQDSAVGFDSVEWIFTEREDYIPSLYAELSKHNVVMAKTTMQRRAREAGFVSVSSQNFSYIFVFDVRRYARNLARSLDVFVQVLSYREFRAGFPGRCVLLNVIDAKHIDAMYEAYKTRELVNERLSSFVVEMNYTKSFLGMRTGYRRWYVQACLNVVVFPVAVLRYLAVHFQRSL